MMSVFPRSMIAWQSREAGLDKLVLGRLERPVPGPHEALVAVAVAALNFSDLLMITDRYQVRPPRPFVPGQEVAGRVEAVGPDCGLRVGQRIASKVFWGGFASHVAVRDDMAIPVPDGVDLLAAATLPIVYTTAGFALTECSELRPGESLLVLGAAGGVGLASVEIARSRGGRIFAAASSEQKRALARSRGADEVVDYRDPDWPAFVKARTDGRGVDLVVDTVGGEATRQCLRCMAWGGRLLVVGFASGVIPAIPAHRLLTGRLSAIGVYWDHDRDAAALRRIAERSLDLLIAGAIRPHVDRRRGLSSLPAALADLRDRQASGKIVLELAEEETGS